MRLLSVQDALLLRFWLIIPAFFSNFVKLWMFTFFNTYFSERFAFFLCSEKLSILFVKDLKLATNTNIIYAGSMVKYIGGVGFFLYLMIETFASRCDISNSSHALSFIYTLVGELGRKKKK
ncbi:MAG: hypothetical protein IKL54_02580 [Bacteroidaceae bacterium]|nr:hypothetical protein [Bacteroidaceae bacterium]